MFKAEADARLHVYCAGTEPPAGEAAVGWQVGVYWRDDGLFYRARCAAFEPATGQHLLAYEDGERESLRLRAEAVKWLLPPPVRWAKQSSKG